MENCPRFAVDAAVDMILSRRTFSRVVVPLIVLSSKSCLAHTDTYRRHAGRGVSVGV